MSSSSIVTGAGPADCPAVISAPHPDDRRDPWLRNEPDDANMLPPAGQPGHGMTAYVRRQPVRIVDGRFRGGYTGMFEVICPSCGDHPYLDYSQVPPRLQWLRGPRPLQAALAAYHKHLGLSRPVSTTPESSGPGSAAAQRADGTRDYRS